MIIRNTVHRPYYHMLIDSDVSNIALHSYPSLLIATYSSIPGTLSGGSYIEDNKKPEAQPMQRKLNAMFAKSLAGVSVPSQYLTGYKED